MVRCCLSVLFFSIMYDELIKQQNITHKLSGCGWIGLWLAHVLFQCVSVNRREHGIQAIVAVQGSFNSEHPDTHNVDEIMRLHQSVLTPDKLNTLKTNLSFISQTCLLHRPTVWQQESPSGASPQIRTFIKQIKKNGIISHHHTSHVFVLQLTNKTLLLYICLRRIGFFKIASGYCKMNHQFRQQVQYVQSLYLELFIYFIMHITMSGIRSNSVTTVYHWLKTEPLLELDVSPDSYLFLSVDPILPRTVNCTSCTTETHCVTVIKDISRKVPNILYCMQYIPYDRWTHKLKHTGHVYTRMAPIHMSMQVIVHYGLPDFTWTGSGHSCVRFLNTSSSCVHTHTHARTPIHTKG